ncbi:MAG: ABC transporter permease [Zetaproteobacteria bacterium]|nr:MAG: ABC transporter permease [Zetaproteobacteria bacterium]
MPAADTLLKLMAAWLLLAGAAAWASYARLGLARPMLWASLRGLIQLLLLAWVLQWLFDIRHPLAQSLLIAMFCVLAGRTSAGHHARKQDAWLAASVGLLAACALTLPWLVAVGAIDADTRTLLPLGSMIAANGMNAISLMFHRMGKEGQALEGMRAAMIPPIDTLRVVGLVHMPGIFVGMILAGATALDAASAQLMILYMIVASSFSACMISMLVLNHRMKRLSCA